MHLYSCGEDTVGNRIKKNPNEPASDYLYYPEGLVIIYAQPYPETIGYKINITGLAIKDKAGTYTSASGVGNWIEEYAKQL